jgi:hypothetical protein
VISARKLVGSFGATSATGMKLSAPVTTPIRDVPFSL